MVAQRHAERVATVDAVAIHLAEVVVHTAGTQHRAGDAGADGKFSGQLAHALRAGHEDFVAGEKFIKLIQKPRILGHDFLRPVQPAVRQVTPTATKAHIIAHHARARERLDEVQNLLALAEGIHQRRAQRAHVLEQEPREASVVQHARQLGGDEANVFRALGHLQPDELLDRQCVSPVVRQRAEVIQPVRIRHRAEVTDVLGNLLVVPVQVAEHRLELHHRLAVEHHVHAEDAVRRGVLRPHRDFEQLPLPPLPHRLGLALEVRLPRVMGEVVDRHELRAVHGRGGVSAHAFAS